MGQNRWLGGALALVAVLAGSPTAVAQRATETAVPFHCSGEACFVAEDRCGRYVQDMRDLGQRAVPCREARQMACFDYYDVYDDAEYSRCYAAPATCQRRLRRLRRGNYWSRAHDSPRYAGVSECETFRYSARRAQELARAQRELEEEEALLLAMRAEYAARAARREAELTNLVLGGAALSPAPVCDASTGRCGFAIDAVSSTDVRTPAHAYCLAGVNPSGSFGFVCYATRAQCVAAHAGLAHSDHDAELPLRVSADCFLASDGGENRYTVDRDGEEVPAEAALGPPQGPI